MPKEKKLPTMFEELDSIPEALRDYYVKQDDDTYLLTGVDDKTAAGRLGEFRSSNIELKKKREQLEEALEKFKDLDPTKYAELLKLKKRLDGDAEGKLIAEGKIDEVVASRTKAMRDDFDAQNKKKDTAIEEGKTQVGKLLNRLGELTIDNGIVAAMDTAGLKPQKGALQDIKDRTRKVFRVEDDGDPKAYEDDGKTKRFGVEGKDFTFEDMAAVLLDKADHLFQPGEGGGAGGGKGGKKGGTKVLADPSPTEFGASLKDIADGKVTVE